MGYPQLAIGLAQRDIGTITGNGLGVLDFELAEAAEPERKTVTAKVLRCFSNVRSRASIAAPAVISASFLVSRFKDC
jgi:hypothetical protein